MAKLLAVLSLDEVGKLKPEHQKPAPTISGPCLKCGKCCVIYNCPLIDPVTHLCSIYDNRPMGCRTWPRRQQEITDFECPGYTETGL